jgi:hypothetical protein
MAGGLMVVINENELQQYVNIIAYGYCALANARLSEPFHFPIGEILLLVKEMADGSATIGELSRQVLEKAANVAKGV